jgi:hypothetical protein
VTPASALVLIGFGVGALAVAGRGVSRAPSLRAQADMLREQTRQAQLNSAQASLHARELAARWSALEDAARREGR